MKVAVLAVWLGMTVGCAAARPDAASTIPANAVRYQISLFDVDCAECADRVVVELRKSGDVHASSFDKKRVVLTVSVAPSITAKMLLEATERAGFRGEIGGKGGAYQPDEATPAGADVSVVVADGRDLPSLAPIVVANKITIVDFYAGWCGPCRDLDKHVKGIAAGRTDLAYRRLDVVDWDSPLAVRYLKNVPSLPYVIVFDRAGKQVDAIAGLDLARLDGAIAKASKP